MTPPRERTILCLASEEKGHEFLRACKRHGCRVLLLTRQHLAQVEWPREAIDDIFYLPSLWNRDDLVRSVSYLARTEAIDVIVPLDDWDVEMAALLREHLRIPGMGETLTRHFRDKLAMRVRARECAIQVPEFMSLFNDDRIRAFVERVSPPWLLKPRLEAGSLGIKKVERPEDLWRMLDELGDQQSFYLLEQYVPGEIYHVDSILSEQAVVFAMPHRYGRPLMDIAHSGGLFTTRTLPRESVDAHTLGRLNREVLAALGLVRGVAHTEFIRGREDGRFYFLETGARVGGAYIADVVEAATGINLWAEWAKIEIEAGERPYMLPPQRDDYGGIILTLARQEWPDTSAYDDPEVVTRIKKRHHAGLIIKSGDPNRIEQLLESYGKRFYQDFFTTLPPKTAR